MANDMTAQASAPRTERTEMVVRGQNPAQARASVLIPTNFDQALRLADSMARNSNLPDHLYGQAANCLQIVELATRWNMSPYAVATCTFKVGKQLGFEGKLLAAAATSSGAIVGEFNYLYSGVADERKVVASARRRSDGEIKEVEASFQEAATRNEHWRKSPDQMLSYFAARKWVRKWTPGVTLGTYSYDELAEPERFGDSDVDGLIIQGDATGPGMFGDAGGASGAAREPDKLWYPITHPKWSKTFDNSAEWVDQWERIVAGYASKGADGLARLQDVVEMNATGFDEIELFDAEAVATVRGRIAAVMPDSAGHADEAKATEAGAAPATETKEAVKEAPRDEAGEEAVGAPDAPVAAESRPEPEPKPEPAKPAEAKAEVKPEPARPAEVDDLDMPPTMRATGKPAEAKPAQAPAAAKAKPAEKPAPDEVKAAPQASLLDAPPPRPEPKDAQTRASLLAVKDALTAQIRAFLTESQMEVWKGDERVAIEVDKLRTGWFALLEDVRREYVSHLAGLKNMTDAQRAAAEAKVRQMEQSAQVAAAFGKPAG